MQMAWLRINTKGSEVVHVFSTSNTSFLYEHECRILHVQRMDQHAHTDASHLHARVSLHDGLNEVTKKAGEKYQNLCRSARHSTMYVKERFHLAAGRGVYKGAFG